MKLLLKLHNRHFLLLDLIALALIPLVALTLRLGGLQAVASYTQVLILYTLITLVARFAILWLGGIYKRYWRYASAGEIALIFQASLVIVIANVIIFIALHLLSVSRLLSPVSRPPSPTLPRSLPIIDGMLLLIYLGGSRFLVRLAEYWHQNKRNGGRRTLIIGAGDAGRMIAREMKSNPQLGLEPIGFIDDDPHKKGTQIQDLPVFGGLEDLSRVIQAHKPQQAIIAMPSAGGKTIRRAVELCQDAEITYKTIPGVYELLDGSVSVTQAREVGVEDLLRRDPITIESQEGLDYLEDAVVLVTGAGGSIGSELCRQIGSHDPRRLVLLGHGENSIYRIHAELTQRLPDLDVVPVIADIRDRSRLNTIFDRHQPDVVFHAAAHKHVPLMEQNVVEAVTNNILGTHAMLQASHLFGVSRFVLISTDKAVNPVNTMGVTKSIAELLVQDMAHRLGDCYTGVRFGNVLGSRGSVVPLFKRQIAEGGPITITHPEMKRYFMTIPEAVQLVLQAGTLAEGGEIFVLDMGEQVRIVELAEELIRLSGLEPERDIDIVFTQPRPGEKLSEELFAEGEEPHPTKHEKILVAAGNSPICQGTHSEGPALTRYLEELETLAQEGDPAPIIAKLQDIVPGYQPH